MFLSRPAGLVCLLTVVAAVPARAQLAVTQPAAPTPVASANDFATRAFQDPADMNERTDVGWWLNSVDMPLPGWRSTTFSGGLFTGVVSSDPNLWVLETNAPNLPAIGKNGSVYPIDANTYRLFAVRMRVPAPGYGLFLWSTNTMYEAPGLSTAGIVPGSNAVQMPTTPGWRIYLVDLAGLSLISGSDPWSGIKRSLRFDPAPDDVAAGSTIAVDWIRLVDLQPALVRTVNWTNAGGPVDIYLDNDNSATANPDQTLGLLAPAVSGSSYSFNVGALAPGRYYVAIRRSGTSDAFAYSAGYFDVNAPATIEVTSPSEEGSPDDFATVHLNNAWDMKEAVDVDTTINLTSGGIAPVAGAETEAGVPLDTVTGFVGINATGVFDPTPCNSFSKPVVYPMHPSFRGASRRIDPAKYRILTAELGLPDKARDLCGGSIVRVVWQVAGETHENYSYGITLNSRAGANVINHLNLDVAAIPIDPASPSRTGWVPGNSPAPGISGFRIDPHEFANPTPFYLTRVKLAALETANTSYTVRWHSSRTGGSVNVYYDTDKDPAVKTFVGSTVAATSGSLVWNTAGLPEGSQYFVYVEQDDGVNVNGTYGKWPIRITHTPAPTARLVLNRSRLNFGVTAGTVKSPPQVVRLTVLDAPAGQPCWTVSSELWFLAVSPSSGCGSATLTVSLLDQFYPAAWNGEYTGTLRVASANALNSPQGLVTTVRMTSGSSAPAGVVDTPDDDEVVEGSLAMTGWATDDIGIARVTICRDGVAGEPVPANPLCGPGQVYLGDAVSIDDARPDVELVSPATPLNYRAGWGFLILTNMLPMQGSGSYLLHARAYDLDGFVTPLGSRRIVGRNATAIRPFGAIDTPGQGETIGGASYANFGWVLSRVARADPLGGGTVAVFVDGMNVGSPCCWSARSDLTAIFAGYPGVERALGVFGLNTYAFGNGLHTIVWSVVDSAGQPGGIGSRFFSIFNADAAVTQAAAPLRPAGPDLGRQAGQLSAVPAAADLLVRHGPGSMATAPAVGAGNDGVRHLTASTRGRLGLRLRARPGAPEAVRVDAYRVVDGVLADLPLGSTFDTAQGAFYWLPGPGSGGTYDFLLVRTLADGRRDSVPVTIEVPALEAPEFRPAPAARWRMSQP